MKFTIDRDLVMNIQDLNKDEVSVVSTTEYNTILHNTQLTEMLEDRIEVGIKLVIRNTFSNEVLVLDNENVLDLELLNLGQTIKGYFQVIATLDKFLRSKGKVTNQIMSKTHLNTLGVLYNSEEDKLYHIMNLIVLDDQKEVFTSMFENRCINWEKIVDLISSPYISKFDKIILSKLRIVN